MFDNNDNNDPSAFNGNVLELMVLKNIVFHPEKSTPNYAERFKSKNWMNMSSLTNLLKLETQVLIKPIVRK